MKFRRYWAKGAAEAAVPRRRLFVVTCWRWSDLSIGDALAEANDAARRAARRLAEGRLQEPRYGYGDQPLREEVLRELGASSAGPAAPRHHASVRAAQATEHLRMNVIGLLLRVMRELGLMRATTKR